ncbi:radical SAM protein [Sandaracinus amylolyticus]|uniref:Radical SAM core domain-containing protein n=1 Tax=Sandaracinus amylolyticus TaxID=927083 RepID=A0A0F6SDY9_9BACT|nr:radical SAM protein [Sandaracinus amylolyticus]AKF04274.1 hypothetical protein DB32_001423 [Sandaracinus amylolyticus]
MHHDIPIPSWLRHLRRCELDGALLLFDRETGLNALIDGEETAHLRRQAPRVLQFALTNHCNLACTFCSRDLDARSAWTADSAFRFLSDMAVLGTLEVAFGGGEPLVLKGFADLVARLHDETPLAVSFTTNGTRLDSALVRGIAGKVGQIRLSIYDDSDWRAQVRLLAENDARFGINYLVTRARAPHVVDRVLELVELGARDVLLLSYNGHDASLHLDPLSLAALDADVRTLMRALAGRAELKLDVCWGDRLPSVPRALDRDLRACAAGVDHLVITSDRQVAACSFHHLAWRFETADDVMRIWRERRDAMSIATAAPGCARDPDYGLETRRSLPVAMEVR